MYSVYDYYENPFGERIFVNESYEECVNFCKIYNEECDGECKLQIGIPEEKVNNLES